MCTKNLNLKFECLFMLYWINKISIVTMKKLSLIEDAFSNLELIWNWINSGY